MLGLVSVNSSMSLHEFNFSHIEKLSGSKNQSKLNDKKNCKYFFHPGSCGVLFYQTFCWHIREGDKTYPKVYFYLMFKLHFDQKILQEYCDFVQMLN